MNKSRAAALVMVVLLAILATGLLVGGLSAETEQASVTLPITINDNVITQTTTFTSRSWASPDSASSAEIFWDIDQTAPVNTLSLKLQVSPNNSLWTDYGSGFVTSNVTDTTGYSTTTILGRYFRVVATAGNSNPVTPTIMMVLR